MFVIDDMEMQKIIGISCENIRLIQEVTTLDMSVISKYLCKLTEVEFFTTMQLRME